MRRSQFDDRRQQRRRADLAGARSIQQSFIGDARVRGGLIDASGSFLRGRPATLNWRKVPGAS